MLTPSEIEKLAQEIAAAVDENSKTEALQLINQHPEVFPKLSEIFRDDDAIAMEAMGRLLQLGGYASHRLKSDIAFFIKAFNRHFRHPPLEVSSARDLLFVLKFSQQYFHYWHEITDTDVIKWFACSTTEAAEETQAAKALIDFGTNYDWVTHDKDENLAYLRGKCPGFSTCCYEYAYMWASFGKNWDRIAYIW
jgi:hypothetical protein